MAYVQNGVIRRRLLDRVVNVAGGNLSGVGDPLELGGVARALVAFRDVRSSAAQANAYAAVALETLLPDGATWHQLCRFSRAAATGAKTPEFFHMVVSAGRNDVIEPSAALDLNQAGDKSNDLMLTRALRARFVVGKGGAAAMEWTIRVDVDLVVFPELVT